MTGVQTCALPICFPVTITDLGYVWLAKATLKRARYCVKYVVKQIGYSPEQVAGHYITVDGKLQSLSSLLEHRRYTRKFVSAGVGDFLGHNPRPSACVSSWAYMDFSKGIVYNYAIPRYYDRYLKPEDERRKAVLAADAYSRFSKSALVRRVVSLCVTSFLPASSVSGRDSYTWEQKQIMKFRASKRKMPDFDPPTWLDLDVLRFWRDHYKLQLII